MGERLSYSVHYLKCWPKPFTAMWDSRKQFELRRNDRGYAEGDELLNYEWNPETKTFSGRVLHLAVTYLLDEGFGLADGMCVMSTVILDRWDVDDDGAPRHPEMPKPQPPKEPR